MSESTTAVTIEVLLFHWPGVPSWTAGRIAEVSLAAITKCAQLEGKGADDSWQVFK